MNILHLNTNFHQSTIYSNMIESFNADSALTGRVYYPVSNLNYKTNDFVDKSNCLKSFDRFFYFSRNRKLYKDLLNIYKIETYDLVLAYSLFSNGYLAYTLNKKNKVPYIVIVQNTDINFYFKKMYYLRGIGREILKCAEKIVFISNPYKEFVLSNYIGEKDRRIISCKSEIIPFGISDFWFESLQKESKKLKYNKLRLLFVGKVNENKNIITSAKVCELLINMGYRVTFTVVGDIQSKKVADSLKQYPFLKIVPFTNQKDLIDIYRAHDIFIMPSIKESFGLVYGEAMSQGLPVIYTKGQGFDEHFADGEIGYSVDSFDIEDIAKKVILIKENFENISKRCKNEVYKFRWNNITLKYKELIEKVLN